MFQSSGKPKSNAGWMITVQRPWGRGVKRSDMMSVAEERGTNGIDSASRESIYSRFNLNEKPRVSRGYQLVILPRKYNWVEVFGKSRDLSSRPWFRYPAISPQSRFPREISRSKKLVSIISPTVFWLHSRAWYRSVLVAFCFVPLPSQTLRWNEPWFDYYKYWCA